MFKNKNCAQSIISFYRQFRKTVLLRCIYKWQQKYITHSFRQWLFNNHLLQIFPIMLALLCLMLSVTYILCSKLCWHTDPRSSKYLGSSGKYSTRRSRVLYLPQDHTPSAVFYHTTQVYGAFTDLLVLRERTDYFDSILDRYQ